MDQSLLRLVLVPSVQLAPKVLQVLMPVQVLTAKAATRRLSSNHLDLASFPRLVPALGVAGVVQALFLALSLALSRTQDSEACTTLLPAGFLLAKASRLDPARGTTSVTLLDPMVLLAPLAPPVRLAKACEEHHSRITTSLHRLVRDLGLLLALIDRSQLELPNKARRHPNRSLLPNRPPALPRRPLHLSTRSPV